VADSEWGIAANVRPEAFGRATSPGTRHFTAGTLVWCLDVYWGMGGETLRAIGRHRGGRQLIAIAMPSRYLTNFRAKVAYSPRVVHAIREHQAQRDEAEARRIAGGFAERFPAVPDLRERAKQLAIALRALDDDPSARELAARATELLGTGATPELEVLGDLLEDRGAGMPLDELAVILRRRRDNP
jgi:hypothetical protein